MGKRNVLVEGVSGAGKTSVAEELERRGFHVVHGDRVLAYHGDPETGEKLQKPAGLSPAQAAEWGYPRWIWPVDPVLALQADTTREITFFCGGTKNAHKFLDGFEKVFVLDIDPETLKARVAGRGDDEFGGKPEELAIVLRYLAMHEPISPNAIRIDTNRPLSDVVDTILAHCGLRYPCSCAERNSEGDTPAQRRKRCEK